MNIVHRMQARPFPAVLLYTFTTAVVAQPAAPTPQAQAATMPHVDLRKVCRNVDQQLQDLLARVVYTDGAGVVDLVFDLEGDQVRRVRTRSGPPAHRAAARRAVHRLDCRGAGPARQTLHLQVEFVDADAVTAPGRLADAAGTRH